MLSDSQLQLLTAFVDGELTRRQRNAVMRLLYVSSEARSVLQNLQENAHKLRGLPHRKLDTAFAPQVLQIIAERGLRPAPEEQRTLRPRLAVWARYAIAASVLLSVGVVYVASQRSTDPGSVVAQVQPELLPHPVPNIPPLEVKFKDLAQEPKRDLLARELQKDTGIHLDVTVRNNAQAVDQLKDALEGQGIELIVDARTKTNLRKGQEKKVEYLVYAENMRAEELTTILRQLGNQPANKYAQETTYETLVVTSISAAHRQNLSSLLGVDASELEAPIRQGESTLFQNVLIEKNKKPAVTPPPAPSQGTSRFAMVLANDAANGPSSEVKTFLASRRQQQPGTVQVLLVIRQA